MEELEIIDDGKVIETVDFGRPETGSKNIKTVLLHNKSLFHPIENITLNMTKDEDYAIEYPKSLKPNESKPVTIRWNPKFERRNPLDTSQMFSGDLLIG